MTPKVKIILVILTGTLLILTFIGTKSNQQKEANLPLAQTDTLQPFPSSASTSPTIISTKPDPLEGTIIKADEIIEITFSHPLENEPEFRRRFDPEIEYKIEVSSDKKVVKFIPEKPYELGVGYTLFISPETKFEGGGKLDGEKTFHFSTIKYRGV